ncbi:uncharacterized protein BDR25DRAFT_342099 [Lindgomyces ingoldianus]|uniref:Uncharacterized protein n=1 Tax=Lindgomyces ingoldianus TaxID=673940 RepID=A0ACB6QZ03_9PLEO|nr:uncharacterized protein BDR25DRAFT_342099 [Lindgomyces ingoldianus]KAF2472080.1 hypothetical protein BDR25DRAFT_342099 [Lindgomyces ingoldianus]
MSSPSKRKPSSSPPDKVAVAKKQCNEPPQQRKAQKSEAGNPWSLPSPNSSQSIDGADNPKPESTKPPPTTTTNLSQPSDWDVESTSFTEFKRIRDMPHEERVAYFKQFGLDYSSDESEGDEPEGDEPEGDNNWAPDVEYENYKEQVCVARWVDGCGCSKID